jgi:uncharacterized protein DUF1569
MGSRSLAARVRVEEIVSRLGRLDPASGRQWGTLTAHEMLCHLGDSFDATLDARRAAPVDTWWTRTVLRGIALHTSIPWPKGVPTRPEVDPRRGGSKPLEFERDRARVVDLVRRFASAEARYGRHPIFGALTRREWLVWGYRHADHHLRQFGV